MKIVLLIYFLIICNTKAFSQNDLFDLMEKLSGNKKKSLYSLYTPSKVLNNCLKVDTTLICIENFFKFNVNNKLIDSIARGNEYFEFNMEEISIVLQNTNIFKLKNDMFYILPIDIKNCVGSFCSIPMCFLLNMDSLGTVSMYYFVNSVEFPNFFFSLDKNNNLLFFDICNVSEDQEKYRQKYDKWAINTYKITPYKFNTLCKRWEVLQDNNNNFFAIFQQKENGSRFKVLQIFWIH